MGTCRIRLGVTLWFYLHTELLALLTSTVRGAVTLEDDSACRLGGSVW
jgi:hypothetical protein